VDRLVHERERVVRGVQVTDAVVDIDGLHRIPGQEMDRIQQLRQPQQVLVVLAVAGPSSAIEVGDIGRAPHGPEGDPIATELDVALGVAGMKRERRRGRPDRLGHEVRVEANALRVWLDLRARRAQHLARIGIEEVHADLGQHAQ
jgi:hypothetical protein